MPRGRLATLIIAALASSPFGCGTDAVGVDACHQIQQARCRQAPACGIEAPNHTSGTDVDACIRFYNDECLHGLSGMDPGPASVSACVDAINRAAQMDGGCAIVAAPQLAGECSWLTPPNTAVDASTESTLEATSEAQAE